MINEIYNIDEILLEINLEDYNDQDINDIINYILLEDVDTSTLLTEIPQIISKKRIFDGQFNYSFDPILNESNILLIEIVSPIIEKYIPQHIYRSFTNLHVKYIVSEILNVDISTATNIEYIKQKITEVFLSGDIKIPIQSLRSEPIANDVIKYGLFAPVLFKLISLDNLNTAKTLNDLIQPINDDIYSINIVSRLLQFKKDSKC